MAMDRGALLIYLKDIRTLETIISESKSKKEKLAQKKYSLTAEEIKVEEPKRPELPQKQSGDTGVTLGIGIFFLCITILLFFLALKSGWFEYVMLFFGVLPCFIISLCCLIQGLVHHSEFGKKYRYEMRVYNREMEEYNQKIEKNRKELPKIQQINENRRKEVAQRKNEMMVTETEIDGDIQKYEAMLQEAYNEDIIPLQFRSIEGIYYLYDFLSTSQLTLADALMHADLQSIKNRLDEMIQLQKANVILQAQNNARLEDVQRSNLEILDSARATEQNTAIAAQYARIAAISSRLSLELQAEQLGYQKADFWLK